MDHLPYPSNSNYPPIEIPYLADSHLLEHDGHDFEDLPSHHGWTTNHHAWYECDARTAAARAQQWLYFGLLQVIFGSAIQRSDFVISIEGQQPRISTRLNLPPLLKKWSGTRRWRVLEFIARYTVLMVLAVCTGGLLIILTYTKWGRRQMATSPKLSSKVVTTLQQIEAQTRKLEQYHPTSQDVALTCVAIRALLWSVRNAAANKDPNIFRRSRLQLSSSPYMKQLTLQRGFCPHEMETLQDTCSIGVLHYLSAYSYHHHGHQNCSTQQCVAYILDPSDYISKHVESNCSCDFIRADMVQLKSVIDSGQIPVIVASVDASQVQLSVRPTSPHMPYVAISHAWSGGLGNPRTSSLPACQIRRIASILQPLFQPTVSIKATSRWPLSQQSSRDIAARGEENQFTVPCVFWMDTLCIPTRQEVTRESETRIKALSNMNRIYAEAAHVVVLDDSFTDDRHSSGLQFASNVLTSSWMTRCWTYLEGRLAQNLLVAADGTLRDPFTMYHRVARYSVLFEYYLFIWNDTFQVEREMASTLYKLRSMVDSTHEFRQLGNFVESWNELLRRTTSRRADLLIIFALMLDLSIYEAELIDDMELRLLSIIKSQNKVPISFLFEGMDPGYRVNEHCNWLPQTLAQPVNATCGWLRKDIDKKSGQHYFQISVKRGKAYVFRVQSREQRLASFKLHLRSEVLPERNVQIHVASMNENETSTASSDIDGDFVYIIPASKLEDTSTAETTVGCRLRLIQEHPKFLLLMYDRTISCGLLSKSNMPDTNENNQLPNELETKLLHIDQELRLFTNWNEWPTLAYQRSNAAKPMTSKHGPVHIHVGFLAFFELALGLTTAAMIVIVFPLAEIFAPDFWFTATAAEWFGWALCIVLVLARAYILLKMELPSLNRSLKTIEFQRWAASFNHGDPGTLGVDLKRPLSQPYQYHSWAVIAIVVILSGALMAIGLIVNRPMLYDLTMLGGYFLVQVVLRITVELIWRSSWFDIHGTKLAKWYYEDSLEGLPSARFMNPLKWTSKKSIRQNLSTPNLITHHTAQLDEVFGDPMYFPETYRRAR